MPVRLPSRRLVRRLLVAGAAATLAVTTFLMTGLMADAAPRDGEQVATTTTVKTPRLVAQASLSADYLAPGPQSGVLATPANGRTGPFSGQVIPGFSAAVDNGNGTFWAMPDNGFGTKENSADFLLRVYLVKPRAGAIGVVGKVHGPYPCGYGRFTPTL